MSLPPPPTHPVEPSNGGRGEGEKRAMRMTEVIAFAMASPDGVHVPEFVMTGGNDVIVPAPTPGIIRVVLRAHVEAPEAAGVQNELVVCIHNTDEAAPATALEQVEVIDRDESSPAAANTNLGKNIASIKSPVVLRHPQALVAYEQNVSGTANAYYVDVVPRD